MNPMNNSNSSAQILSAAGWSDLDNLRLDSPFEDDDENTDSSFPCTLCNKEFTLPSSLKKHERIVHGNPIVRRRKRPDSSSESGVSNLQSSDAASKRRRRDPSPEPGPSGVQPTHNNLRRRSRTALNTFDVYKIFPSASMLKDLELFLKNSEQESSEIIQQKAREKRGIKYYLNCKIRFVRDLYGNEKEYCNSFFRSKNETCLLDETPEEKVSSGFEKIKASCEEFQTRGSGWKIDEILFLEVNTCAYHPLAASSYIPLPPAIAKKKAVINIQNNDEKCFQWCILAALHPAEDNVHRVRKYLPFVKDINIKDIKFSTPLSQIDKFEKMNNLSINVFGYDREVFLLKITKAGKEKHVNLLLISDGEKRHYTLIKNLNRLLTSLTKHGGSK